MNTFYPIIDIAQKKEVAETRLTFDEAVKLAYPIPPEGQNIMFTIKYGTVQRRIRKDRFLKISRCGSKTG